mmetsp:Transcript_27461/g.24207  ORF Transcript_27461/g.24207 Transcript_27461/m.24207 type:complete len:129 (-) Transcript_27461:573-959(-)
MNTFIAIPLQSAELFAKFPINNQESHSQSTPTHFPYEDFSDELSIRNSSTHQKSTFSSETPIVDEVNEDEEVVLNQSRKLKRKVRLQNFEDVQTVVATQPHKSQTTTPVLRCKYDRALGTSKRQQSHE